MSMADSSATPLLIMLRMLVKRKEVFDRLRLLTLSRSYLTERAVDVDCPVTGVRPGACSVLPAALRVCDDSFSLTH